MGLLELHPRAGWKGRARKVGSVMLYFLIACIGVQMDLLALLNRPGCSHWARSDGRAHRLPAARMS